MSDEMSNINSSYGPPQTSSRQFLSQHNPSTSAYSGDDSDMSAKLELLKQKKADIWKHFTDFQFYKNLGMQAKGVICDIQVTCLLVVSYFLELDFLI